MWSSVVQNSLVFVCSLLNTSCKQLIHPRHKRCETLLEIIYRLNKRKVDIFYSAVAIFAPALCDDGHDSEIVAAMLCSIRKSALFLSLA